MNNRIFVLFRSHSHKVEGEVKWPPIGKYAIMVKLPKHDF